MEKICQDCQYTAALNNEAYNMIQGFKDIAAHFRGLPQTAPAPAPSEPPPSAGEPGPSEPPHAEPVPEPTVEPEPETVAGQPARPTPPHWLDRKCIPFFVGPHVHTHTHDDSG
jgi:hypothetical protein